jgi:hypothetical protein
VKEYQELIDKLKVLKEIAVARKELDNGEGIPHNALMKELKSKYST